MKTILRVFSYLKRYPKLGSLQLICAIVATLLAIVFPNIARLVLDEAVPQKREDLLISYTLLACLAYFGRDLLNSLRIMLNNTFEPSFGWLIHPLLESYLKVIRFLRELKQSRFLGLKSYSVSFPFFWNIVNNCINNVSFLPILLVKLSLEGKTVVRLKGGDPYVFGRGGEEAQELNKAEIPFEIVPGISSSIAGPAYAGIPVTHRDCCSQLTIFTGHEDPNKNESVIDYSKIGKYDGTKVMLMGVGQLEKVTSEMISGGAAKDTPVALIRWATTGRQETLLGEIGNISQKVSKVGFKAPAVAVFGEVVNLRDQLNWFEGRSLYAKKMVVTRTRTQAGELSVRLRNMGADVDEMPTIRIEPPEKLKEFGQLVQDSHKYDWIVFTSPNGVDAFFDIFFKLYKDARSIGGAKIAVIGPGTQKAVEKFHLAVDLLPERFVAEGLVEKFVESEGVENQTILLVRPEKTRDVISKGLNEKGAIVDEAIAYRTVPELEDPTGAVGLFTLSG